MFTLINSISRLLTIFFLLSLFFLITAPYAQAVLDDPYIDKNTSVSFSFDRAQGAQPISSGSRLWVWRAEKGGNSALEPDNRVRDSWACIGNATLDTGACQYSNPGGSSSNIKLKFTEKRSRNSIVLNIRGQGFKHGEPRSACGYGSPLPIQSAVYAGCAGYPGFNGKVLDIWLHASEADKIPSGGIWEATLVLYQYRVGGKNMATWTANITLNIIDKNSGDIFLPAFGVATPLVDLNLRTRPLSTAPGGEVSGSTVIDTCLYDGYNVNSPWLKLTLSDTLPSDGRAADIFSVVKTSAPDNSASNRVDYRAVLDYNGQSVVMENGKERLLNGANSGHIRLVTLPGISVPVVCAPTPISLTTLPFNKAAKSAGQYRGVLRMVLSATALAP